MPFASHAAFSSSLIGREASDRSVSPLQNFSKPPPVPEMPTVTWTPEFAAPKASAAAVVSGPTVEEPSAEMVPDRFGSAQLRSMRELRSNRCRSRPVRPLRSSCHRCGSSRHRRPARRP